MATEPNNKFEAVERLYMEADIGVSAETVLRVLEPLIEQRLAFLLDQFGICKPELGELLDLKARITETWRIRKELKNASLKGKRALEALQSVLDAK